jgi:hypothetical protein
LRAVGGRSELSYPMAMTTDQAAGARSALLKGSEVLGFGNKSPNWRLVLVEFHPIELTGRVSLLIEVNWRVFALPVKGTLASS